MIRRTAYRKEIYAPKPGPPARKEHLGWVKVTATDGRLDDRPVYSYAVHNNRGAELGTGEITGDQGERADARKGTQRLLQMLQDRESAQGFSQDVQAWASVIGPELAVASQEVSAELGGGMGR